MPVRRLLRVAAIAWPEGILGAAIGIPLGIPLGVALVWWLVSGPPVIVDNVEEADMLVTPGDATISLVVHADRARTCPTQVSRYLWRWIDWDGQRIPEFRSIDNPPLTPMPGRGKVNYMVTLAIPSGFPAGDWFERTVVIEQCPWLGWLFAAPPRVSPDRPVTIRDHN